MPRKTLNSREKVLSYLTNRKGKPVTNEEIAIGTRLRVGTVGPLVARLIDRGVVARVKGSKAIGRSGSKWSRVALTEFIPPDQRETRPARRSSDSHLLDYLESQGDGSGWVARHSTTGRGFRLHNPGPHPTARAALEAFMQGLTDTNS